MRFLAPASSSATSTSRLDTSPGIAPKIDRAQDTSERTGRNHSGTSSLMQVAGAAAAYAKVQKTSQRVAAGDLGACLMVLLSQLAACAAHVQMSFCSSFDGFTAVCFTGTTYRRYHGIQQDSKSTVFSMNFAEPVVSKMTEVYQTVHMRELTDVPENDPDDHPTCDALALA